MNQDQEHLRLLSIFYYVCAGLAAFGACFWALIFVIGIVSVFNPEALGPRNDKPDDISDLTLAIMAVCLTLLSALCATLNVIVGTSLSQRKRYTLCLVVAGFSCALFPFGTALGIFSLIVLTRSSVKALFDQVTPPVYAA